MTQSARPTVAIVGNGRLARAFGRALRARGYRVRSVASRPSRGSARNALAGATVVLVAVSDAAVRAVAERLARECDGWPRRVVLHHAGALAPDELAALAELGASVGVLHPLQSLAAPAVAVQLLPGSAARIEGDRRATAVARRLATDLGLLPLRIPRPLTPGGRAAYHAAAALVANDLVALIQIGTRLFERLGVRPADAEQALARLARGVTLNIEALGLAAARTGPVARGDAKTLAAHLAVLARVAPNAARAHRALSAELGRRVARRRPPRL